MAYNHFSYVPSSVTEDRSGFKFRKAIATGAQLGWLYPMCRPVDMLPGSTLKLNFAAEIRSGALISSLFDSLDFDIFAFNVPNRIVWEHWKQFLGAVDDVLFDNLTEYKIPSFPFGLGFIDSSGDYNNDDGDFPTGNRDYIWNQTLACHFELPWPKTYTVGGVITENKVEVSALPFRGYNFIVNEFFIPEYLEDRILFSKTDEGMSGDNMIPDLAAGALYYSRWDGVYTPYPSDLTSTEITNRKQTMGGVVLPVYRAHRSLWTSCLPKPSLETLNLLGSVNPAPIGLLPGASGTTAAMLQPGIGSSSVLVDGVFKPFNDHSGVSGITGIGENWVADVSQAILTVNNYRETILLQNYYDCLNRSGSRYDEILANLFHTRTSMAIISIPELIVHKRFTIYRKDVVATAQTNNGASVVKPIGSQSSYIDTIVKDSFFTKSTTEHGLIHMLFCIRPTLIRMTSGFEPYWTNLDKLSQFYPQFQGMGDVPRKKMEVTYGFDGEYDDQSALIGYQEYSAEYKYQRSSAVGWFDPHAITPLTGFVITDEWANTRDVVLTSYFLSCASEEVSFSKCLAISSPIVAPQFLIDLRLEGVIYHPMKVYNIPGQGDLL